jgi:chromate reductase
MHKVAVLVGSLRRESNNLKLAKSLARLAAGKLDFQFSQLGDLPLYNDDLWSDPPSSVLRMKSEVAAADGVLFVTPEYNRSVSPALKNAIDWGTRPWGQNSWAGKPLSIVGSSPGVIGSAVAQAHLRSIMVILDAIVLGQPEVYLSFKPGLIDDQNEITDEPTRKFLSGYVDRLAAWIARHKS